MKFADAHVHLSDDEYSGRISEILMEAKNSDVVAMVANSMNLSSCEKTLELCKQNPGTIFAALGIHPQCVKNLTSDELDQVLFLISAQKGNEDVVAVGEIGLDYKYSEVWKKQLKVFDTMLHAAEKFPLPVVIHSREAASQVVETLSSYNVKKVLLHWFSGSVKTLNDALDKGCYVSEGPAAVYIDPLRDIIKNVPMEKLLTETDGPVRFYKKPFEGKETTPALIPQVVAAISEIKSINKEKVARQILENFEDFFDLKLKTVQP